MQSVVLHAQFWREIDIKYCTVPILRHELNPIFAVENKSQPIHAKWYVAFKADTMSVAGRYVASCLPYSLSADEGEV